MRLLWMVLMGLFVGGIAKLLMPGKDPGGVIVTILLGIAGSLLGGFLFGPILLRHGRSGPGGLLGSIAGAVIILLVYRLAAGRRRSAEG